jgi:alkylhydroperoxidase/carboxymuconolactone decarboxylase family protein YurZ
VTTDRNSETTAQRLARGTEIVADMFGKGFLDDTMARPATGDDAIDTLGHLSLAQCYGDIWARPGLSRRDRSLITLGLLMAAGHRDEIANHTRGALANGVTPSELTEAALHAAPYIGLPATGHAMAVIAETCRSAE